jgi:hypothetical protein
MPRIEVRSSSYTLLIELPRLQKCVYSIKNGSSSFISEMSEDTFGHETNTGKRYSNDHLVEWPRSIIQLPNRSWFTIHNHCIYGRYFYTPRRRNIQRGPWYSSVILRGLNLRNLILYVDFSLLGCDATQFFLDECQRGRHGAIHSPKTLTISKLHNITIQKTTLDNFTSVRASNFGFILYISCFPYFVRRDAYRNILITLLLISMIRFLFYFPSDVYKIKSL